MSMNRMNLVFLENLEWFDDTGTQLVQRIPPEGSGEIKYGAQLTVRENQAAVFIYKGKALEAFVWLDQRVWSDGDHLGEIVIDAEVGQ